MAVGGFSPSMQWSITMTHDGFHKLIQQTYECFQVCSSWKGCTDQWILTAPGLFICDDTIFYNSTFCSNQHNECNILFACPSSQPPDILLHKLVDHGNKEPFHLKTNNMNNKVFQKIGKQMKMEIIISTLLFQNTETSCWISNESGLYMYIKKPIHISHKKRKENAIKVIKVSAYLSYNGSNSTDFWEENSLDLPPNTTMKLISIHALTYPSI